jgi:hypothetical protein
MARADDDKSDMLDVGNSELTSSVDAPASDDHKTYDGDGVFQDDLPEDDDSDWGIM